MAYMAVSRNASLLDCFQLVNFCNWNFVLKPPTRLCREALRLTRHNRHRPFGNNASLRKYHILYKYILSFIPPTAFCRNSYMKRPFSSPSVAR
jgi:hypothetical protein